VAKKPEAIFKDGVHKQLPPKEVVYRQSMFTGFSNGTPDHYYEAKSHLWIEYKWLEKVPLKGTTPRELLSAQQLEWAKRALKSNQPWACVTGVGRGKEARGVICGALDDEITRGTPLITKEEIANWICQCVGAPNRRSTASSLQPRSPARSARRTKCPRTDMGSQP
jgi:hypothetical protein